MVYEAWPWHVARRVHREMRVVRDDERDPEEPKKKPNSEIWGKGVCGIWEKWVSGWRHKRLCSRKRIKF